MFRLTIANTSLDEKKNYRLISLQFHSNLGVNDFNRFAYDEGNRTKAAASQIVLPSLVNFHFARFTYWTNLQFTPTKNSVTLQSWIFYIRNIFFDKHRERFIRCTVIDSVLWSGGKNMLIEIFQSSHFEYMIWFGLRGLWSTFRMNTYGLIIFVSSLCTIVSRRCARN